MQLQCEDSGAFHHIFEQLVGNTLTVTELKMCGIKGANCIIEARYVFFVWDIDELEEFEGARDIIGIM